MSTRRDECRAKHRKVAAFLDAHDLDAVVLTRRCNFAWYTAGGLNHVPVASEVGVTSLLVTREGATAVTNNIEAPRITDEELQDLGIEVRSYRWHDAACVRALWGDLLGRARTAADAIVPGLPDQVTSLPVAFGQLRWRMTDDEIERYRGLGRDVAEGLEEACRRARRGMTEHALAGQIAAGLVERGIRPAVCLVAADDRLSRYRHPIPTDRSFERYGMGVAGGERHGLVVSCSRLFSFAPILDDLRRRQTAVCRVDAETIAATRPGTTLGQVFSTLQRAYANVGFADEWQYHHQGGLTGYLGREVKAGPDDPTVVEAGQVYAWNPTIAGTKCEDTVLVGQERNEILSATDDWPTTDYPAGDAPWPRCDILRLPR